MSLSVTLYNSASPVEKIGKTLTAGGSYSCSLKDTTSVLNPVLIIRTSDPVYNYNYLYIQEFGRYYFINDIKSVNNNVWEISAHVDVLETYKSSILANEAVIRRQDKLFNLYLDDSDFHVLNYERVQTLKFPANAFSKNLTYVLVVNNDRYW
jgi:hypothetical protein